MIYSEVPILKRLKELRKERNLTQRELGAIVNSSDRSIGFYETGERDPDTQTLDKLANFFDVSVDYLLGRTSTRNYNTSITAFHATDDLDEEDIELVNNLIERLKEKHKKK